MGRLNMGTVLDQYLGKWNYKIIPKANNEDIL
jgi:hypothetical protein